MKLLSALPTLTNYSTAVRLLFPGNKLRSSPCYSLSVRHYAPFFGPFFGGKMKVKLMLGLEALKLIRSWQRESKAKRCTLTKLATKAKCSVNAVRNAIRVGVRKRIKKHLAKQSVLQAPVNRKSSSIEAPPLSARTIRRIRLPIRNEHRKARKDEKINNFVDPDQHSHYDSSSHASYFASQRYW